jgi:ABC-type transporter Mla subunit MlaD
MTRKIASDTVASEAPTQTAAIIPFRARTKPQAPPPAALPASEDRLVKALATLNAALADQRAAVAAWRDVLAELKTTTKGLDDSLQRYRSNLRSLGTSVSSLHAKARSLEQWADGVLTKQD